MIHKFTKDQISDKKNKQTLNIKKYFKLKIMDSKQLPQKMNHS